MTDYTVINLKQVEDQAPTFGYSPELEARFARDDLELEHGAISYQRLAPGFRIPWGHTHSEQEEIYVIVSGSARLKLDEEVVDLGQWYAARIGAGTMRGLEAGPEGAELIAFGAPRTETASSDLEMAPGWWSD